MEFKGVWGAEDLGKFLDPGSKSFFSAFLNGTVTIDGLCMDAPMAGTLELRYVTERRIRYTFDFEAKGKAYHFVGEKVNILPWNLLFSHTTCFGRLTEKKTGKLVSTSVTFFKLASALKFLASFRLKKSVA